MGFNLEPAGLDGFWGPPTSTLDWCEENYVVSFFCAEWWNTFSNLNYIFLAMLAWYSCWRVGCETRVHIAIFGLFMVGVGSFSFHATLLFEAQMMDELPMIYATALQLYVLVQSFPPEKSKVLVVTVLSTYCVIVTVAYLYLKNPIFHEVCYGFLAVLAAVYPILQIRTLADVQDLKGSDAIRNLYKLYFRSVFSYLFGFLLWNIENQNCNFFRQWRAGVGYPLRVFGELHMYWHLFTGIASYGLYIMAGYIRLLVLRRRDVKMVWYAGIIPVLQSDLPRSRILELDAVKKTA